MCLIDMNKFFEKTYMTIKTYSLHAVDFGFNNNKHIIKIKIDYIYIYIYTHTVPSISIGTVQTKTVKLLCWLWSQDIYKYD